ncbi:MAG: type II secretion system protein GspM [Janthinobacterium sp.]
MLPLLKKWATAFDALSLRERLMVFGAGAAAILFVFYFMSFNPLLAKRTALEASIAQKQSLLTATDKEIALTMLAHASDPDQEARTRLLALQAETASLAQALRAKQHGLVAPERMVTLLEHLLRRHAGLRVVSLKTLPSSAVGARQADSANGDAAAKAAAPAPLLHQHGVEVVLQGSYADMVQYVQALQSMPTRVFWGAAHLDATGYPGATLTLTLHTLSMDDTWIAL